MLSGKEALYFLIRRIADKRITTPKNVSITLDPVNDLNKNYTKRDLENLMFKLAVDEGVIKIAKRPNETNRYYKFWTLEHFDDYHDKLKLEPEYQKFTGEKVNKPKTTIIDLDHIEVLDELDIVKEARKKALKDQQETFDYLAKALAPQLDFKTPTLALDTLRESVERIQKFNEGLFAFRNVFSAHTQAMQDLIDASRQTTQAFQTAIAFTKRFDEILKTPLLLPAPVITPPVTVKPRASIEHELRQEMAELRSELVKYRELIEQPPQPLLAAKNDEPPVRYDKNTKTIFIKGISVEIDTNTRSGNQVDICDLLFKNKTTIKSGVSNKEIFETWGNYDVDSKYVREQWRAIYQVVKRINEKVSNKTYAPQFLKCDTYRTKINKFYL